MLGRLAGPVPTKTPTVADYLTYWLREVVEPNLAPLTYSTYDTLTRLYIVPGVGAKRIDRLQVRDVQTWINQIGRLCQCCIQTKGRQTARRQAAVLRGWAVLSPHPVGQHDRRPAQGAPLGAVPRHDRGADHP